MRRRLVVRAPLVVRKMGEGNAAAGSRMKRAEVLNSERKSATLVLSVAG